MRAPTYTPRERACIAMADRIVVRLHTQHFGWVESEVRPTQHEDLAALLRRVQGDLEHGIAVGHSSLSRALIYAVADHPLWGEMRAVLPRSGVPDIVQHPLTALVDPHYPIPRSSVA